MSGSALYSEPAAGVGVGAGPGRVRLAEESNCEHDQAETPTKTSSATHRAAEEGRMSRVALESRRERLCEMPASMSAARLPALRRALFVYDRRG